MKKSPSSRVAVADCIHEVCSFNPHPTRYDDLLVHRGDRMPAYHRGIGSEVAGALGVLAERKGLEAVPAFGARGIASGGTIPAPDLRGAGPVAAAAIALHGAMATEGEDDPEGLMSVVGEYAAWMDGGSLYGTPSSSTFTTAKS